MYDRNMSDLTRIKTVVFMTFFIESMQYIKQCTTQCLKIEINLLMLCGHKNKYPYLKYSHLCICFAPSKRNSLHTRSSFLSTIT